MRRLERLVQLVSTKDVTLSIYGESGAGKEVLARRVHELSRRSKGPFVPINCAAVPEQLFESELFGHERGAFTGATERVVGKIEAADGGTLFLDEVGEMPLGLQAKLLRALEHRRFTRVGGTRKLEVDIRLLCAAQGSLEEAVRVGRFRADLFYRIQGIPLHVPPLRERREDLQLLIAQFRSELARQHGVDEVRLSRGTLSALTAYSWPGNVRELRNVLEFLTIVFEGRLVRPRDLPPSLLHASNDSDGSTLVVSLDRPLDESVDAIVGAVLALEAGNVTRTAERLGISVRTLQRRRSRAPQRGL
jgi:transcriptional regulator with PAS, ATPase and Fis domain